MKIMSIMIRFSKSIIDSNELHYICLRSKAIKRVYCGSINFSHFYDIVLHTERFYFTALLLLASDITFSKCL